MHLLENVGTCTDQISLQYSNTPRDSWEGGIENGAGRGVALGPVSFIVSILFVPHAPFSSNKPQ